MRPSHSQTLETPASEIQAEEDLKQQVLIDAGLFDTDPHDGRGLVFPLPSGAEISKIVRGYDSRNTSGEKVRCAACPQHQPHFRGFRVELVSGEHARIGVNCGEHHFGDGAWQTSLADYNRRVEHANFNARIKPTLAALEQIMPLVEEWHSRAKLLAKGVARFRSEMPELWGQLASVAKLRDGRLEREKRVKKQIVSRIGKEETRTHVETTTVGKIPFPGTFMGETPNNGLNGAK